MKYFNKIFLLTLIFVVSSLQGQVLHQLSSNSYVQEFLISGSFHDDAIQSGDFKGLLEKEFVAHEPLFGTTISPRKTIVAQVGPGNTLNLNNVVGDSANAAAYVYFQISSDTQTKALFMLKAEDGAKTYVNGEVCNSYFSGYSEELFFVHLEKGNNDVVIKVVNKDWGWKLKLKILEADQGEAYLSERNDKYESQQVLSLNTSPKIEGGDLAYMFTVGRFPELAPEKPGLFRDYLGGDYEINTRWFDGKLNEVLYPDEPGRYGYYAEIHGENGKTLKRSGSLFCAPGDRRVWNERWEGDLSFVPINNITRATWERHRSAIKTYMGSSTRRSIMHLGEDVLLLSFLDDMEKLKTSPSKINTPYIHEGDYQARLKQKILGVEGQYEALKLPKRLAEKAPVLQKLSWREARKYKQFTAELDQACEEWIADDGSPFDMLIAKDGKIIYHNSFGEDGFGKFTTETPSEVASITKLMTGLLFAQFVDQGIINLDDPVGMYLPDFPLEGPQAVTLRQCFTHTSGFTGHARFKGVYNNWLENSLVQVIESDTVGTLHTYNGMGYDLAGKVMEVVSGKSVFRLFDEYLYGPLELENTVHDYDLGFSCQSTAYDMAKVAQMLLNKGSYGELQFFTPETYELIIPFDLKAFFPDVRWSSDWDANKPWGIGIVNMEWKIPDDKTGKMRPALSDKILGHGSATASVFWVVPEHNIIVTQSRRGGQSHYAENFTKVMKTIDTYMVNPEGVDPN